MDQADYGDQILGLVPGSLVVGLVQLVVVVDLENPILYNAVWLAAVVNCGEQLVFATVAQDWVGQAPVVGGSYI